MMGDRFVLLLVQGLDETQEQLLVAAVKKHADAWWHEFEDAWIVRGSETPVEWRNRLQILFGVGNGSLVALGLQGRGDREWATLMPANRTRWLEEHFNNTVIGDDDDPWADAPAASSTAGNGEDDPWANGPAAGSSAGRGDDDPWASEPASRSKKQHSGYDDEPPF